jgi:alpha-galactosidase
MKLIHSFLFVIIISSSCAQNYYESEGNKITLNNETISKSIHITNDSIYASELKLPHSEEGFITKSKEFAFKINEKKYSGFSGWELTGKKSISDEAGGKGVEISLDSKDGKIQITLNYLLYPKSPIIRKWLIITNTSDEEVKLEDLNVVDLQTNLSHVHSMVYHNYGRMRQLGRFIGSWDDPVVVVHHVSTRKGMALGNEATAVLKRTAYHSVYNNVEIGLTHQEDDFPFRKWLKPGEAWESPKVFLGIYENTDDGYSFIDNEVNEFVVRYMKPKIVELEHKPTFVYNTWNPFRTFINDTLIHEVATAAAECGIQEFIIDDGWQINIGGKTSKLGWGNNYGDWEVDTLKFRGGLKPTFDYIKSLGMKPGLWMSIGAATADAKVFQDHPEWFVRDVNQELEDIHQPNEDSDFYSSCFGTDWPDYIKKRILHLVNVHGLAYAKLDFAVVTSAYVNNDMKSGCHAKDHPYHKDHHESFWVIYQNILKLYDELHAQAPDLFIDCTFETAGKLQLMDYAIAQHADGNWLSNFEEPSPVGPLRIRHMAWWRSPAVPASSLVIGNQVMDDPEFEFSLKSLIGTLPIVLGDPRKMSAEKRKMTRAWSDWMQDMQETYDYMSYRKDLTGFGEPQEGSWDGWQRINFQTKEGGIFGVFRQGAGETARTVILKDLIPDKEYVIKEAPSGETITRKTGQTLMEEGIEVRIVKKYDGRIFEVTQE